MLRSRAALRTWILAGLGVIAVLVSLGIWGSSRLQSRARSELVRVLSAAGGARANVGSATIDLGAAQLVARDIRLVDGARELLRAGELRGQIGLADLFIGRLQLGSVTLTGVRATLRVEDLQRFGAELHASPSLERVRLPDAAIALDLGGSGLLRAERTSIEIAREGDRRRVSLSRAPVAWLVEGNPRGRAQLATTCALPRADEPARCDVQLERGRLSITFDPSGAGALQVDVTDVSLAQLLDRPAIDAALGGKLALRRTGEVWHGSVQLQARQLRAGQAGMLAVPKLTAAAELRAGANQLSADRLRIELPRGKLDGRADFDRSGVRSLELASEALDLADLESLAGVVVAGRGRVALRVQPPGVEPAYAASIALSDAAVGGVPLGQVTAELSRARGSAELQIDRARVSAPEHELDVASVRLSFDGTGLARADAELRVARLPLAELYRSIGAGADPTLAHLQAASAGTARVAYRRDADKARLALDLALQLTAARLAEYPFDRGLLRARLALDEPRAGLAGGVLELEQLSLSAGGGELQLSGKLDRGALSMRLAPAGGKPLPLQRFPWLRAHAPAFSGELLVNATLSGNAARPRADVQVAIDALRFRERTLGRIDFAARLADRNEAGAPLAGCRGADVVPAPAGRSWRICGEGLQRKLRADVAIGDAPERAIRGQLELEGLALDPFLPRTAAGRPTRGSLRASVAISAGSAGQPERISGRAHVRELSVGEGAERIANVAPFDLHVRNGQLELREAVVEGPGQRFALGASGALGAKPKFIADGTIAAGLLTRTTEPTVTAFGDVGVRLEWSMTQTPAVRGRVDVRDVVVRAGIATLRKLTGSLALEGERVSVTGVAAELGGGRVDVTGRLDLAGLSIARYDLALKAKQVSLAPEPLIELEFDADNRIRWTGGTEAPEISGRVNLKRLVYRKQIHPEAIALAGRRPAAPDGADRVRFDLTVEHEAPVRIQNSLIDGELSCTGAERSLRVLGSDRRLGLVGQLAVTRGRVVFQGDEFQVQRGTIDFRDPKRIAPKFDLLAIAQRAQRPDARVVLSASGTDRKFDVAVRCEVPPPIAAPPPFNCRYEGAGVRCDDLDELVAQFVCRRDAERASRPR